MFKLPLPDVVMVGGRKRAGKDFLCDSLVRYSGFVKLHIVEPYLRAFFGRRGLDPDLWEELKPLYRAEIQAEAEVARAEDPLCLIRRLPERIDFLRAQGHKVAITGVRFTNEVLFGVQSGYLVVKVWVPDSVRRQRFIDSGESLELFDDPFEREIDQMQWPLEIEGTYPAESYPFLVSAGFGGLHQARLEGYREAA